MLNKKWKNIVKLLDFAFQPIVNVRTGKLFGLEALLRNVKEVGYYNSIFALFDGVDLGGRRIILDLELRHKAFSKFAKIDIPNIQLFYNLDNRLIYEPDFIYGNTLKILDHLDIDKKRVCFELSERGSMEDPSAITNMVNRYKQEGFDIAIDDFGTGIAGFKFLYYAESNFIKIDRFFIDQINIDAKKKLFCASIIDMAHIMGIRVIAEGIETKEEYYTCKSIGADLLQGFFIQKPKIEIEKIKSVYSKIEELFKEDMRTNSANTIDKTMIEYIKPINIDSHLEDLFCYFEKYPNSSFVPVINKLNQIVGVIYEKDLKHLIYSPYGLSLAKNKIMDSQFKKYIKDAISVEITWSVDKVLELFNMNSSDSNGIFITSNKQYKGFVNLNNLLSLSYRRNLDIASNQNPLTKLPGNQQIEEFLDDTFNEKNKRTFYVIYFDFNDFKPFNDSYGFRQGDRAILLFADILRKELKDAFIGHVGGDDFFVGFKDKDFKYVYETIFNIQQTFKNQVKTVYNKEDRKNNFIKTKDRFGIKRTFKLLEVAAVIAQINKKTNKDNFDLILGTLKKSSKKCDKPVCASIL